MRNKFGGKCYLCGLWVPPGTGHFERSRGQWLTRHALFGNHGRITCEIAKEKAPGLRREARAEGK